MDTDTAKRVSALLLEASGCIDESVAVVEENCSATDCAVYRESISKIMTDLWFDVLKPIYVEHPDLEPYEVKKS